MNESPSTREPAHGRSAQQSAIEQLRDVLLLGRQDLDAVLETVARIARDTVPGADEVSVTLVKDDKPYTAAFTGELAVALDERQYGSGFGPCLDAAATGATVLVDDMASDQAYPAYSAAAVTAGVGSSLSVGLPVPQGTIGAINLYSTRAGGFDAESITAVHAFAAAAAIGLANAALYADAVAFAQQMQQAMASRATIEQAKGILMRDNHCSPDEAFAMLVQASTRSNRKLRDIARSIAEGTQHGR